MTTDIDLHLLNDFQRDFPLVSAPFAAIAECLRVSEADVLAALTRLQACGKVSRVGAIFRPHRIGSSTLAALAVPPEKLDDAAHLVSSYAEVNHNYEREHRYNLWFVVTAADEARVQAVLNEIERDTGYQPLNLPMLEDFHIDLGFDLSKPHKGSSTKAVGRVSTRQAQDKLVGLKPVLNLSKWPDLLGAIQHGLPLVSHPFAEIGSNIGISEQEVIAGLAHLLEQETIKRIGVIVRHHELGYRANAMVVWDIPDEQVSALGHRLGSFDFVTLCYRRPRRLPDWRYNLFTMIHGQHRDEVLGHVAQLRAQCGLENIAYEVLFSLRRFKQRGAHYMTNPSGERKTVSADAG